MRATLAKPTTSPSCSATNVAQHGRDSLASIAKRRAEIELRDRHVEQQDEKRELHPERKRGPTATPLLSHRGQQSQVSVHETVTAEDVRRLRGGSRRRACVALARCPPMPFALRAACASIRDTRPAARRRSVRRHRARAQGRAPERGLRCFRVEHGLQRGRRERGSRVVFRLPNGSCVRVGRTGRRRTGPPPRRRGGRAVGGRAAARRSIRRHSAPTHDRTTARRRPTAATASSVGVLVLGAGTLSAVIPGAARLQNLRRDQRELARPRRPWNSSHLAAVVLPAGRAVEALGSLVSLEHPEPCLARIRTRASTPPPAQQRAPDAPAPARGSR